MNKADYITEANRQLSDTKYYEETTHDLTFEYNQHIQSIVSDLYAENEID